MLGLHLTEKGGRNENVRTFFKKEKETGSD